VHFAEVFQKCVAMTSDLNFFKFLAFFRLVLVVSYLKNNKQKIVELLKFQ